jgi:heterodisulfide reductase subunit C
MAVKTADDRMTISDAKDFKDEIEKKSGQKIPSCYQCGECTAGCPVAFASDLMPNQTIRLVQLNQDEEVLNSSMIWLCVGCETCATRCPKGVELSKVMDALRETAIERKVKSKEPSIKAFHDSFLHTVALTGRTHEIGMIGEHKLRTGNFFSDLLLGAKMFAKGKLTIMPSVIKGRGEVGKIFKKSRECQHKGS